MTQSIELFLQFVHLSKPKLQNTQINFYTVVARGIISFTAWIREDESLHPIFVDTYEDLVEFSRIPVIDSRSPHANISDDLKNRIRATLFQSSSNNSLNMSDFDRYVGGIGSILILQRKSSLHATQQGIATTNEPSYHLLIITESILDPFLSTLDTIVDLLSSDIVSERLTSVAICGVPYIFSTLSTLLFDILSFVGQSSSTFMSTPIQHDLSLCLMLSDILLALVVSPSNQMMNSLEILAASTDPEAGEYLKVSTSACKYLLFQINQLTDMRNVNHTLTEEEIIDFHNLIERLRSLEEIFQNLFQRPHQSHLI